MTSTIVLCFAAMLWLAPLPQNVPFARGPLRNSFATGGESLIDAADALDLHASDDVFKPQLEHLQATSNQLKSMAQDQRESNVAKALNDLLFAISACHIQAAGGNPTTHCEESVARARVRSMAALEKHKTATGWQDGPPA